MAKLDELAQLVEAVAEKLAADSVQVAPEVGCEILVVVSLIHKAEGDMAAAGHESLPEDQGAAGPAVQGLVRRSKLQSDFRFSTRVAFP